MVEWARFNLATLKQYHLVATGTTGGKLERSWVFAWRSCGAALWAATSRSGPRS